MAKGSELRANLLAVFGSLGSAVSGNDHLIFVLSDGILLRECTYHREETPTLLLSAGAFGKTQSTRSTVMQHSHLLRATVCAACLLLGGGTAFAFGGVGGFGGHGGFAGGGGGGGFHGGFGGAGGFGHGFGGGFRSVGRGGFSGALRSTGGAPLAGNFRSTGTAGFGHGWIGGLHGTGVAGFGHGWTGGLHGTGRAGFGHGLAGGFHGRGFHGRRFFGYGGNWFYPDYAYDYGYGYGDCWWLRHEAIITGSPYWWSQYEACLANY